MKKLLLTMVFVFALATFSTINAKETKVDNKLTYVDCVAVAFYYQSYLEALGVEKEEANYRADKEYDRCVANQPKQ